MMSQRDALSDLLAGGGFVVQRTVEALDRVNRLFSDQNIKTLSAAMSDVQGVTAELRERKSIIADAQKTLQDADDATKQITALARSGQSLVDGDGRQTFVKMSAAATEIQEAAKTLRTTLARLEGPTETFATTSLPQLTSTLEACRRRPTTWTRC